MHWRRTIYINYMICSRSSACQRLCNESAPSCGLNIAESELARRLLAKAGHAVESVRFRSTRNKPCRKPQPRTSLARSRCTGPPGTEWADRVYSQLCSAAVVVHPRLLRFSATFLLRLADELYSCKSARARVRAIAVPKKIQIEFLQNRGKTHRSVDHCVCLPKKRKRQLGLP